MRSNDLAILISEASTVGLEVTHELFRGRLEFATRILFPCPDEI